MLKTIPALIFVVTCNAMVAVAALVPVLPAAAGPPLNERTAGMVLSGFAVNLLADRGWMGSGEVRVRLVGVDEMDARLARQDAPAETVRDSKKLWALLGFAAGETESEAPSNAPASADAPLPVLWDPDTGQILLRDDPSVWENAAPLRHAVAEALAAQRLARGWSGVRDTDAFWARRALVQGDATAWVIESSSRVHALPGPRGLARVLDDRRLAEEARGFGRVPSWPHRARLFATLDGLAFVADVRQDAPWSEVDALWRRPPQSTAEILHPILYRRRWRPVVVTPAAASICESAGEGWSEALTDTLGEMAWQAWLETRTDAGVAARAAAGWAGDRVALCLRSRATTDDGLIASLVSFASAADAEDFARTAQEALRSLCADDRWSTASATVCEARRRDTRVALLVRAPVAVSENLFRSLWEKWKVGAAPAAARQRARRAP